jgi:2-polyprenyl-3-methyl-5-hydroxy-6-metoxy-1,4-benzoquinol methylase
MTTIQLTKPTPFDSAKAEAFAGYLMQQLNGGAISIMLSHGHRLEIFDKLASQPPLTSNEIAELTNLNERYVREWLGAMVVGRILDYWPEEQRYQLPAEHAACLTRGGRLGNMAAPAQFIAVLCSVEEQILDCFRHGGGVSYEAFRRFHQVMAEESDQTVRGALLDHILPIVPGLIERLEAGIRVLDVGCGSGRAINFLAQQFPRSQFVGYDFCEITIARARADALEAGTKNVEFVVRNLSTFDQDADPAAFDLVTGFDVVHDQARPAELLAGIARTLKPNGVFLMQDIHASSHLEKNLDNPMAPFLYTISCNHCMTVSLAQNGAGLGTCWGEELALEMLAAAGFSNVTRHSLEHDVMNTYFVCER